MQAHLVHDAVHDKRGPGHIAGVFEKGNSEKQQQDIGQKNKHPTDARNNTVN